MCRAGCGIRLYRFLIIAFSSTRCSSHLFLYRFYKMIACTPLIKQSTYTCSREIDSINFDAQCPLNVAFINDIIINVTVDTGSLKLI